MKTNPHKYEALKNKKTSYLLCHFYKPASYDVFKESYNNYIDKICLKFKLEKFHNNDKPS